MTYAFSDIHGCLRSLDTILAQLPLTAEDHLIFLGDYIDRGADSKGVIDRVLELKREYQVTCLMGNHEEKMLLSRVYDFEYSEWIKHWDAQETMDSYGARTIEDIPEGHWEFLRLLSSSHEEENHIYVHANVEHDLPLSGQSAYALTHKKLKPAEALPHHSGKTVICGHTAQKSHLPLNLGHTICIDTDAGRDGPVTCLCAETMHYWQATEDGTLTEGDL